jgi:uncharacterized membrane protein (UPF0127 family)
MAGRPSFLKPLTKASAPLHRLESPRTGAVVAARVLTAFDSASRRTGLLKSDAMPEEAALVIAPTNAIHTFFMRFAIDVAFIDRAGKVVAVRHALVPRRLAMAWRAHAVIEMAAGTLARAGVVPGDSLALIPV